MATITSSTSTPVTQTEDWQAWQRAHHRIQFIQKLLLTMVTGFTVLLFFFPVYFWITASVKPFSAIYGSPILIPETTGTWWSVVIGGRSYADVIREMQGAVNPNGGGGTIGYYAVPFLVDSIIIGLGSTVLVLLLAVPTAYALSRLSIRFKQNIVFFILSTRFMPAVTAILPIYLIYQQIRWVDTYHGLMLAHTMINLPIAILLLKSFFDDVPTELDDAAMVDGCTRFGAFRRIIIRYVAPGIAAAAVLCLIFSWNEFILTLYLTRVELRTIPIAMATYDAGTGDTEWGFLAAAGSAAMIPVFVFILFAQRHLIRGLTMGAVKS